MLRRLLAWMGLIHTYDTGRHPQWAKLAKEWLKENPFCEGCGIGAVPGECVPHHILPVSWPGGAERELDKTNLITLCETGWQCHFRLGHKGHWRSRNLDVRAHAANQRHMIETRELPKKNTKPIIYGPSLVPFIIWLLYRMLSML